MTHTELRAMLEAIRAGGNHPWGGGFYSVADWRDAAEYVLCAFDEGYEPDWTEAEFMAAREDSFAEFCEWQGDIPRREYVAFEEWAA